MNRSKTIKDTFLRRAADILGKSGYEFTAKKMITFFSDKSFKYDIDIPYSTAPLPKGVDNKRNALYENLVKFPSNLQFEIIDELCENKLLKDYDDVQEIKQLLHERYSSLNS